MSDAAEPGDFIFQRGSFAPQHELLRCHHAFDGRSNLAADGGILGSQIKQRHGLRQGIGL